MATWQKHRLSRDNVRPEKKGGLSCSLKALGYREIATEEESILGPNASIPWQIVIPPPVEKRVLCGIEL
ncbi:MAG: hypothetical protein ISS66_14030 [Desulfobacteraceae bacterium]|nr:hypothetical protein [Desulfobacteraceae bacterium]